MIRWPWLVVAVLLAATPTCLPYDAKIFLPVKTDAYELPGNRIPRRRIQELSIESTDHVTLAAIVVTQADVTSAPSLLLLHGQGGNIDDYWDWMNRFYERGYHTLIVDYRGYGKSTGQPTERGLYDDAAAAHGALREWTKATEEDILLWGYSLGAAVASHLSLGSPGRALVLEAPFTSMADIIEGSSPYAVPAEWLSDVEFDTLGRMGRLAIPLVVAHGREDRRIPPWMGEKVFEAAPEPKHLVSVRGAGHGNTLARGEREIFTALRNIAP